MSAIPHLFPKAPVTEQIIKEDSGDSELLRKLAQHAAKCEADLYWYQDAQSYLASLRWHLSEVLDAAYSHNRAAERLGWGKISESKLDAAKAASSAVNVFFGGATKP